MKVQCGDRVKVVFGSYAGYEGEVTSAYPFDGEIVVQLDANGGYRRYEEDGVVKIG